MGRLEELRNEINTILYSQKDAALQAEGWVHLYAVSQNAELIALRRGLDPEISTAAGLLHDIYTFRTGEEKDHARHGSDEAIYILRRVGEWKDEEIAAIAGMISHHSDKDAVDGPLDECLKDADVFSHWLYDREKKFDTGRKGRLEKVFSELNINGKIQYE